VGKEEKRKIDVMSMSEDEFVHAISKSIPALKIMLIFTAFCVGILIVDALFIFWILDTDEHLQKLSVFHSAIFLAGGLLAWVLITVAIMLPMKVMTVESLRLGYRSTHTMANMRDWVQQDFKELVSEARAVLTDVREIVAVFKKRDFGRIESAITQIEGALGRNGDLSEAIRGLAGLQPQIKEAANILSSTRDRIEKEFPDGRQKVERFMKVMEGLAEYFEIKLDPK
jgi:hypothetical protein